MTEEIFGPIIPTVSFKTIKEAVNFVLDRDKPLAVYYFGDMKGNNCRLVQS